MRHSIRREKHLVPYSLFYLITLQEKEGASDLHDSIHRLKGMKDYDFEKPMKRKVANLEERMKRREEQ